MAFPHKVSHTTRTLAARLRRLPARQQRAALAVVNYVIACERAELQAAQRRAADERDERIETQRQETLAGLRPLKWLAAQEDGWHRLPRAARRRFEAALEVVETTARAWHEAQRPAPLPASHPAAVAIRALAEATGAGEPRRTRRRRSAGDTPHAIAQDGRPTSLREALAPHGLSPAEAADLVLLVASWLPAEPQRRLVAPRTKPDAYGDALDVVSLTAAYRERIIGRLEQSTRRRTA